MKREGGDGFAIFMDSDNHPRFCFKNLLTDCWTLWSRRRSVSTPWSTWCWTRPTGCWTWASCPTSSASSTIPTCPPRWVHVQTLPENNVVQQLQGSRQTLMFSATFPETIRKVASEFLHAYLFLSGETPPANPLSGSGSLWLCSVRLAWKPLPRFDLQATRMKMGKPSRWLWREKTQAVELAFLEWFSVDLWWFCFGRLTWTDAQEAGPGRYISLESPGGGKAKPICNEVSLERNGTNPAGGKVGASGNPGNNRHEWTFVKTTTAAGWNKSMWIRHEMWNTECGSRRQPGKWM